MMDYVTVTVDEVIRESGKAVLLRIGEEELWMPRSQMREPEEVKVGECEFDIEITRWIASEKNLI